MYFLLFSLSPKIVCQVQPPTYMGIIVLVILENKTTMYLDYDNKDASVSVKLTFPYSS